MSTPASIALDQLTDEVVRGLRPGDRVILTSRGRPVAEVIPLASALGPEAGTRSARALGGSLAGLLLDRSVDDAVQDAVGELDRASRGLG